MFKIRITLFTSKQDCAGLASFWQYYLHKKAIDYFFNCFDVVRHQPLSDETNQTHDQIQDRIDTFIED